MSLSRWLLAATLVLSLSACKVELYSELQETEANEMVSLLMSRGIDAEKGAVNKGLVTLNVEEADLSAAIQILNENGYPKDSFNDLGSIFQEQGLISSPLEERVRFIYGLSQTLAETLTQIDGVITARVHVVLPEQHPLDDEPEKATASVFLKTRPGMNLEPRIPQIKLLVQGSVEGLAYDDVVVSLFEADPGAQRVEGPPLSEFLGFRYAADSEDALMMIGGGMAGLLALLVVGNVTLLMMLRGRGRGKAMPPAKNG
ncbi:MAG: type III secretion inner membrane ring lipoprotein SctJ [Pseudomonadota bacterium]